jgi:alkaline phosphatase
MKLNKIRFLILPVLILILISNSTCREQNHPNRTQKIKQSPNGKPKNIILMIGDGMGTAQIYAGLIANKGWLHLEKFPIVGFSKTYSADDLITDSAASGTAMATGEKTNNGMVGVTPDLEPVKNIVEIAEDVGKSTGLVATSTITHATPAAFIAHVDSRNNFEEIADQFLETDIDVFIGGGSVHFIKRLDQRDLTKKLSKKGYSVCQSLEELDTCSNSKIAGLVYEAAPPNMLEKRGNMLSRSTKKAIDILSRNDKGFFLMVESAQIDWGNHQNNVTIQTLEMLDFDNVIGEVLEFAVNDGETLVIVTADHETGGLAINGGNMSKGTIEPGFTTMAHTAVMVPVFAFGPKSELFSGIYDNTEIFHKMLKAYGIKP